MATLSDPGWDPTMPQVRFWKYRFNVPRHRAGRVALGGGLLAGGMLGFLPILGFWMIPAGLLVLSVDHAGVRRWNRRTTVSVIRRWHGFRGKPARAAADPQSPDIG